MTITEVDNSIDNREKIMLDFAKKSPNTHLSKLIILVSKQESPVNLNRLLKEWSAKNEVNSEGDLIFGYYIDLCERQLDQMNLIEAAVILESLGSIYGSRVDHIQLSIVGSPCTEHLLTPLTTSNTTTNNTSGDTTKKNTRKLKKIPIKGTRKAEMSIVEQPQATILRKDSGLAYWEDLLEHDKPPERLFQSLKKSYQYLTSHKYSEDSNNYDERFLAPNVFEHSSMPDKQNQPDSKRNYKLFTRIFDKKTNALQSDINVKFKNSQHTDEENYEGFGCSLSDSDTYDDVPSEASQMLAPEIPPVTTGQKINVIENRLLERGKDSSEPTENDSAYHSMAQSDVSKITNKSIASLATPLEDQNDLSTTSREKSPFEPRENDSAYYSMAQSEISKNTTTTLDLTSNTTSSISIFESTSLTTIKETETELSTIESVNETCDQHSETFDPSTEPFDPNSTNVFNSTILPRRTTVETSESGYQSSAISGDLLLSKQLSLTSKIPTTGISEPSANSTQSKKSTEKHLSVIEEINRNGRYNKTNKQIIGKTRLTLNLPMFDFKQNVELSELSAKQQRLLCPFVRVVDMFFGSVPISENPTNIPFNFTACSNSRSPTPVVCDTYLGKAFKQIGMKLNCVEIPSTIRKAKKRPTTLDLGITRKIPKILMQRRKKLPVNFECDDAYVLYGFKGNKAIGDTDKNKTVIPEEEENMIAWQTEYDEEAVLFESTVVSDTGEEFSTADKSNDKDGATKTKTCTDLVPAVRKDFLRLPGITEQDKTLLKQIEECRLSLLSKTSQKRSFLPEDCKILSQLADALLQSININDSLTYERRFYMLLDLQQNDWNKDLNDDCLQKRIRQAESRSKIDIIQVKHKIVRKFTPNKKEEKKSLKDLMEGEDKTRVSTVLMTLLSNLNNGVMVIHKPKVVDSNKPIEWRDINFSVEDHAKGLRTVEDEYTELQQATYDEYQVFNRYEIEEEFSAITTPTPPPTPPPYSENKALPPE